MIPKHSHAATNQRDRWMVSYVDVLTILLIFFVVAAAKSLQTPASRSAIVAHAAPARPEPERHDANLIRAQLLLKQQGLESTLEKRGLVIGLSQVILFSSGEDTVSSQALPTIAQIAGVLRDIPNDVRLIGHADPVPVHNLRFNSNWDLSMARSRTILDLLSRTTVSRSLAFPLRADGPYRPAAPNNTVDGRASNRRVEIVILDESSATGEPALLHQRRGAPE